MTTKVAGRVSRVRGKLKALVQALHPATVAGLLILSVVSGYLNYLAAADLLSAGMVIWQGKTAAATVAIAVSTVIMLFWMYVFAFLPEVKGWKPRLGLFEVTRTRLRHDPVSVVLDECRGSRRRAGTGAGPRFAPCCL